MPNFIEFLVIVAAIGSLVWVGRGLLEKNFLGRDDEKNRFHRTELMTVLLNLDDDAVGELLDLYKQKFGMGPARYARRTLQKWKTGKVRPATQTFERFLIHLPKVMSYDLKCDVLRHFMEVYASKETCELDVTTDDWEKKLDPLVRQIIDKAYTAQLPSEVEDRLRWLGDGDMAAAQQILRASQVEEGHIMVATLRDEFRSFEIVLAARHLKPKVTHVLEFPYGSIKLNIKRSNGRNG